MSRAIDADAFTEFLKNAVKQQKYEDTKIDGLLTVADVIEAVISELDGTSLDGFKNAPTIESEIVRCKDCKYWREGTVYSYCDKLFGMGVLDAYDYMTDEDDYCSMAERRTDVDVIT